MVTANLLENIVDAKNDSARRYSSSTRTTHVLDELYTLEEVLRRLVMLEKVGNYEYSLNATNIRKHQDLLLNWV